MPEIVNAYLVTFGWALVAALSVGLGVVLALMLFSLAARKAEPWELIKNGNLAMAVVMAAVIVALGLVMSAAIRP